MTFRRRQLTGWGVLGLAALLGGAWLASLNYSREISTDILDLIPSDERIPELALVRQLASQAEARAMFFALTDVNEKSVSVETARSFATRLAAEPIFEQAVAMDDPTVRDGLGRVLFEQRFTLLFPQWLREHEAQYAASGGAPAGFTSWLANDTAASLSRFLTTPEAVAFQEIVPGDPLLLMPGAVDRLKGGLSLVQAGPSAAASATLVWARLAVSPLIEAGQGPAFAAIERVSTAARVEFPGLNVAYTGVNRFAAASRARIEREVKWLNGLSLFAVLAIALVFIRGVHRGLHLVPVVLLSVLGAWVTVTVVFDRVHVLVFVVGSLLTGVAIDYGFYLYMQPPLSPGEDYWAKVRRLAKPLLASCLTTAAGFALLLFSELPFIRQLGAFVGSGLICALIAAVVYFSTVKNPFLETRTFRGAQALSARTRRWLRRTMVIVWIAALPGLALLKWRDDIRELQIPSEQLNREDDRIRGMFGAATERTAYLTYAATLKEARAAVEKLEQWLRSMPGKPRQTISVSAVMPTAAEQLRAVQFVHDHPEFASQLNTALMAAGFEEGGFAPFMESFGHFMATAQEGDFDVAVGKLQAGLVGPLGLLLHSGQPLSWFVTLVAPAPDSTPPAEIHTVSTDQLQTLNRIFSRYRQSALWLSLVGLVLVGAGVFFTYGWRDGLRIFAIPCGACLGVFGFFGWVGQPLNLFHLLGAFLGVCLTHNYSIFSATSAYGREPIPVSVRMSALTAAASFGVLALSGIPVVQALGETVALMVIAALLLIEFEHLSALGGKP